MYLFHVLAFFSLFALQLVRVPSEGAAWQNIGPGYWPSDKFTCPGAPGRVTNGNNGDWGQYCIFLSKTDAQNQCLLDSLCYGFAYYSAAGQYQLTRTAPTENSVGSAFFVKSATPSVNPTLRRTVHPSNVPTKNPSFKPTVNPTECNPGFYLVSTIACVAAHPLGPNEACSFCSACSSNCNTCSVFAEYCTSCRTGYFLRSGTCYACSANCATCTSQSLCTQCNPGFYLSESSCVSTCPTGSYEVSGVCSGLKHQSKNSSRQI